LGPEALGGVGMASAIFYGVALFASGSLMGLDYLVSHAFGRKDREACHYWLIQSLYLSLLLSGITIGALFLMPVFSLGLEPAVARATKDFLNLLSWSVLPLLVFIAFRQYLAAMSKVRVTTLLMILANVANAFFGYSLIYGRFGFPPLGVQGSAIATTGTRTLMALGLIGYTFFEDYRQRLGLTSVSWKFSPPGFKELLRLGLPVGFQMMIRALVFSFASALAGRLGAIALAAHTVVLNVAGFTFMIPIGISTAASVLVGQALGRGSSEEAKEAGWASVWLGAVLTATVGLLLYGWGRPIVGLFTQDQAVIALGSRLMGIAAAFQVVDGVQTVATGALRGMSNTRFAMLANLVGFWGVGLPAAYFLSRSWGLGLVGLWQGLTLGLFVVSALMIGRWIRFPQSGPGKGAPHLNSPFFWGRRMVRSD
jgi:MATE family multidrug resistance protein